MGYCGYAAYRVSTTDLPYVSALTSNFITYYNRSNIDELYKLCSSDNVEKYTIDQYRDNINKLKKYADQVEVLDQLGWRSQTNNFNRFLIVQYNGKSSSDRVIITMTFVLEDVWKVYGIHFEIK